MLSKNELKKRKIRIKVSGHALIFMTFIAFPVISGFLNLSDNLKGAILIVLCFAILALMNAAVSFNSQVASSTDSDY